MRRMRNPAKEIRQQSPGDSKDPVSGRALTLATYAFLHKVGRTHAWLTHRKARCSIANCNGEHGVG